MYIYIGLTLASLSLRRYAALKEDMHISIYTACIYIGLALASLSLRRYAALKEDMYIFFYAYTYTVCIYIGLTLASLSFPQVRGAQARARAAIHIHIYIYIYTVCIYIDWVDPCIPVSPQGVPGISMYLYMYIYIYLYCMYIYIGLTLASLHRYAALKQERARPLWTALEKLILYISISIYLYLYCIYIYIGLTLTSLSLRRYAALKQERARPLWAALEKLIPDVRARVVLEMVGSPLTHERYLRRACGSYGPPLFQSNGETVPYAKTQIDGLLHCGDSCFPGIGVPSAAASGINAANTLVSPLQQLALMNELDAQGKLQPRS